LPAPREPDDAPRWLPGDGLVPLWKYSAQPGMQSDGSQPIPVYFHVAPDLYYGETQNLRLAVAYRYNAAAIAPDSALRMYVNGDLINEAPLAPGAGFSDGVRQAFLPVASMRPFGNTLRFNFDFVPRPTPGAGNGLRLQGSILQNSSLDLRGLDHWAAMPNLELFANAGFPFTRLADLGSTTVILPARPSAKEIALFLHLMSHCGTQTGYPALRVEVAGPNEMASADRDYLVLGTIANQPAFTALQGIVPVSFDADGIHVKPLASRLSQFQIAWRKLFNRDAGDTLPQSEDGIPGAVIEGIESPYGSGRSLVMVALRDDGAEDEFAEAFFSRSQSSDIEHSVSLLLGNKFVSYQGDTAEYHIGDVSYYTIMRIWLTEHFLLLLVAVSLCSLVLASGIYDYLRRRAALRLQLEEVARS
jgi:cellulose synthase (UDP-forming)